MSGWKTHTIRTVYSQPPWLTVELHHVELPDGREIRDWTWVIAPNYVNIVPQTEDGRFLCFRQTKYGLDGLNLAIVGGYLEPGEAPLMAAQRELLEETGCEAPEWYNLGQYRVDPNRGIATGYLYLARRAHPIRQPVALDLEQQEMLYLSREELEAALQEGQFKVLAWAAAVAFALLKLDKVNSLAHPERGG